MKCARCGTRFARFTREDILERLQELAPRLLTKPDEDALSYARIGVRRIVVGEHHCHDCTWLVLDGKADGPA